MTMSKYSGYDIYGERLLNGCCEVHPWIQEEYPCYRCIQMQEQSIQQKQAEIEYYKEMEEDYYKSLVENTDGDGI
jgi:hypothetical protein